jgi:arylsulfatase A-like enzyme
LPAKRNRSIIKLAFRVALFALIVLFALLIFHVNDSRLPANLEARSQNSRRLSYGLSQSVFRGNVGVTFSAEAESCREEAARLSNSFVKSPAVRMNVASDRFSVPCQVSLSLGVYPGMVEMRDGIVVPAGGSLRLKLPAIPGVIRFGLAVIDGREGWKTDSPLIQWFDESNGKSIGSFFSASALLKQWSSSSPSSFQKMVKWLFQYVRPDFALVSLTGEVWRDFEVPVDMRSGSVKFTDWVLSCAGPVSCVFSDVEFLSELQSGGSYNRKADAAQNFILVVVDTLRADALFPGSTDREEINTAKSIWDSGSGDFIGNAAKFNHALAPGNMTSPSTNALLGCRTPTELKAIAFAYAVDERMRQDYYKSGKISFPASLTSAGYKTAMIGNISVVSEVIGVGVHHGFQESVSLEGEGYETALASLVARRWIQENKDRPFFLYVHLNAPHAPYKAPLSDIRATWPGASALGSLANALRWLYAAEVSYAARSFSKIVKEIEKAGLSTNTHILLTGDHGDQHSVRRFSGNEAGRAESGAYFDHGATLLDDEVGVPLVWNGPGVVPGKHDSHVSTIGIGPAIIETATRSAPGLGIENPCSSVANSAGRSLVDRAFASPRKASALDAPQTFGLEGYQQRGIVIDGRIKYVRAHEPVEKRLIPQIGWFALRPTLFIREELYDLQADPNEHRNLVSVDSKLLANARKKYEDFYDVSSGFELVVESPSMQVIEIPALKFRAAEKTRVVVPVSEKLVRSGIQVMVGGMAVKVSSASLRLPLSSRHWREIPREIGGEDSLLSARSSTNAYIRRVILNDGEVRRIVSGNPMFDQVLREWGYLHDD